MEHITRAPGKYVQGQGILKKAAKYCSIYGKKPLLIFGTGPQEIRQAVTDSFSGYHYVAVSFSGECCKEEIIHLQKEGNECDYVIGIGGGKVLDTAKAVGEYADFPVIVIPTSASTDAPCSAVSVIYTPEGTFSEYLSLKRNPELVLVDTEVIAAAPVRLLVSGMGDALSTYFEARAAVQSKAQTQAGGESSNTALVLAEYCYRTLLDYGLKAKNDVEQNICSQAVEQVTEAIIYYSGIGFESGGLAAAHAVNNGLSILEAASGSMHGERVAFGTLVQLILEGKPEPEWNQVLQFMHSVGLPTTFSQLGIEEVTENELEAVARASCEMNGSIYHMPMKLTKEIVIEAMKKADKAKFICEQNLRRIHE